MYKRLIKEDDLRSKSLEKLILSKNEQHDLIAIYIPIIFSLIWLIASAITWIKPEILEKMPMLWICIMWLLILSMVFVLVIPFIILRKHNIIKHNLKAYDNVILEKLNEYKKSEQDFKDNVLKAFDELKSKKELKK